MSDINVGDKVKVEGINEPGTVIWKGGTLTEAPNDNCLFKISFEDRDSVTRFKDKLCPYIEKGDIVKIKDKFFEAPLPSRLRGERAEVVEAINYGGEKKTLYKIKFSEFPEGDNRNFWQACEGEIELVIEGNEVVERDGITLTATKEVEERLMFEFAVPTLIKESLKVSTLNILKQLDKKLICNNEVVVKTEIKEEETFQQLFKILRETRRKQGDDSYFKIICEKEESEDSIEMNSWRSGQAYIIFKR